MNEPISVNGLEGRDSLVANGVLLFGLGVLSGFLPYMAANPRMGLASHTVGTLSGSFLIALAAAWPRHRLSARWEGITRVLVITSNHLNWAVCVFSAMYGTKNLLPNLGTPEVAAWWKETVVTVGFGAVGVFMIPAVVLLLIAFPLFRKKQSHYHKNI